MTSKICLGTVQFGQNYGIANKSGRIPKAEAIQILDYAKSVGIECLDTALDYGDSEKVIGEYLKEQHGDFNIVSKFPSIKEAKEFLGKSLQHLGLKQLYGYLLHRFDDIKRNGEAWSEVIRLKKQGKVKKIGFSLYSPDELVFLLDEKIDFDIAQIPYSIFDRRFEEYFVELKNKKIEIQARSIFLQGLFFMNLNELPASLQGASPQLKELQQMAKEEQISIEALCLNFALLNPVIDRVLIGVDNLRQLKDNIASIALKSDVRRIYERLSRLRVEDEDVLLPYKWVISSKTTFDEKFV